MKRFTYIPAILVLVVMIAIGLSSCNKYLELKPQDGIIRANFWQTKEQVQAAVTGCYASLLSAPAGVSDRPLTDYLFMWGEGRADMVQPAIGASIDEVDIYNGNILPTNTVVKWSAIYRTINYCNTVIQFAPAVLSKDNTFTQQQLNAYMAEALTLRSLMYFYLVRSFRDVPLILNAVASDEQIVPLPKVSADTILNQIVSDLKIAKQNAVITYNNRDSDKGKITKYTTRALLADVYLWMDNYTESLAECDTIIASGKFGLINGSNQGNWFNTLYYNGNSNESIFELQFDAQKLNPFYSMFTTTRRRYTATARVMEDFYQIDYVDDTKFDIRGDGVAVRSSDNTIWKWIALDYNSLRSADASYANWIVYRYADILLMKAEALNQLNRGTEALEIINGSNGIRARARALVQTLETPTDKNGITDYILEERAREFSFEGKRWYDVLRNAKRDNYARLDILTNMVAKAVPPERQQSALNKAKDYNSHYYPIYYYELQTDPLLVQNPFYK